MPVFRIFRKLKMLILSDYFSFFLFFELDFSAKMQYNIFRTCGQYMPHIKRFYAPAAMDDLFPGGRLPKTTCRHPNAKEA